MPPLPDDDAYLRAIVAGAAPIAERLGPGFVAVENAGSRALAAAREARWRARLAGSGDEAYARRLAWLGTTPAAVRDRLGEVRFVGELPGWTSRLARVLRAPPPPVDAGTERPFGALVEPFVCDARRALKAACGSVMTPGAFGALIDALAEQLVHVAAPVFLREYRVGLGDDRGSVEERGRHDAFVARMLDGGMRDLLADYPVLARLIAVTTDDFVANAAALAAALAADLPAITATFCDGRAPGRVAALRTGLSDRHDGGRTVSLLTFECGARIVHKPRDLTVEHAWFALLTQCDGGEGEFARLRVLARGSHGWVEFAHPRACATTEDLPAFYRRAGRLLALLYALEASDCFFENIVAAGAWPLLIDMETLMHPVIRRTADVSPAEAMADDILFNSVFRAGFLPAWEVGPAGECVDVSGLGAASGQATSYVRRAWRHVGTDAIALEQERIVVEARDHVPVADGVPGSAADHVQAIVEGFAATYRRMVADRAGGLAPDAIARRFAGSEIRFLIHATRIYGLILKRLGAPRHMRDGLERSIEMEVMARFYLDAPDGERLHPILAAEIAALERLDIPKFTVPVDSRALALATGTTIADMFGQTAIERVTARIGAFDENDLARQCDFIRASLDLSTLQMGHAGGAAPLAAAMPAAATPADLVVAARAIADDLAVHAIRSGDGSATWIAPQHLPGANRRELRPLRMDLYSGLAGVAVFLAGLERVAGERGELALAALAPVRALLRTADPARLVREGYTLGAATGAGGFASSLAWCGEWLGAPALFNEAVAACARVSADWIAADDVFDVMGGSAGAILGMLALHRRAPSSAVLATAVACGDRLLAAGAGTGAGVAWRGNGTPALTGFAHGAGGIAAALDLLAAATGLPRFAVAADAAIAWEDALFDAEAGNWPDLRGAADGPPGFMHAWCHGAPGIGIGRRAGLRAAAAGAAAGLEPRARGVRGRDLRAALRSVRAHGAGDCDTACCGTLGRADLLAADAPADALRMAATVLHRRAATGGYQLVRGGGQNGFFDPSFFQGLAGIGYQLLRIAAPERLPSVLAWE